MKVIIFFQYQSLRRQHVLYGKYTECGLLFEEDVNIQAFYTLCNQTYQKKDFSLSLVSKWKNEGLTLDYLILTVDKEETRKLRATCEACAQSHKPFNMYDVVMMLVPFWEPVEVSLFETKKLNNTQALILILRESLNAENPLLKALSGVNSRKTCLNKVYDCLAPYTQTMNLV